MAKTIIGKHGFYKLDHPCFREVYETTYKESRIVDIQLGSDLNNNLLNLPSTCKIESGEILPVFYNCKKGCYTDETGMVIGDALVDGVKAFEVGESIKVGYEKDAPKYVIGHASHKPKMCADIFKMKICAWDGIDYYAYYVGSDAAEYCGLSTSDACNDLYGKSLGSICTEKGYILFGQAEFIRGTLIYYWGDIFVKVGPIMYILRIESIGLPAPLTERIFLYGCIWTEALEAECKALGAANEHTLSGATFDPFPVWPIYPPILKKQKKFSQVFIDRFSMAWSKLPAPRWVFTELWGEK